jgi:hypothetical protein
MIFGYTFAEAAKAVVAAIALVGAGAALALSDYDPSFTDACIALVGPTFGVAAVFMEKNHTVDDLSKAIAELQAAALFVVGYFTVIPTGTGEKIALLVGSVLAVYAVWRKANAGVSPPAVLRSEPTPGHS